MNRTKQKAALYLLGLFAYLILSITCYQQAWAADEPDPSMIGFGMTRSKAIRALIVQLPHSQLSTRFMQQAMAWRRATQVMSSLTPRT